jgi:hypothetical protein
MRADFVCIQETDIVLFQEVTTVELSRLVGYTAYSYIGATKRGTVIIATQVVITIANIINVLPGLRMSIHYYDRGTVAPSGISKRRIRKHFSTLNVPCQSGSLPTALVLGEDVFFIALLYRRNVLPLGLTWWGYSD